LKKLPGRIVGLTTDDKGNEGFVLTFRARENRTSGEKELQVTSQQTKRYLL